MAFTEFETDTANISKLSDRPNQNDGLSSAQLKGRFDKAGNDIKTYINDVLLDELARITDGDSGADNIGATAVGDGTATTVQGILEEIDADVTALDGAVVHKTGNETIADVKTFTDSPIVPAPTSDTNPATKKYVDDTVNGHVINTNNPHGVTAEQVGAVPTTRTVNSKPLSSDITLSASDVGALPSTDAGDLSNLTTTEKGSFVGAINELNADKIETTAIANTLTETAEGKVLDARQGKVLADIVSTNVGDLETLTTTDKSSLVNATNEVKNLVDTNTERITVIENQLDFSVIKSWSDLTEAVRNGSASSHLGIGDQLSCYRAKTVTAGVGAANTGVSAASVNFDTFISKIGKADPQQYTFVYTGAAWILGATICVMSEYGITLTGSAAKNDIVVISVTADELVWDVTNHDGDVFKAWTKGEVTYYTPISDPGTNELVYALSEGAFTPVGFVSVAVSGDKIGVTIDGTASTDWVRNPFADTVDGTRNHSLGLALHDCFANIQFDAAEAIYFATDGLAAGNYYFTIGETSWQFEITQPVPENGQLVPTWITDYTVISNIKTYAAGSGTAIETCAVTTGTTGTQLTVMGTAARTRYGNNNWAVSAERQYLNKAAAGNAWWEQQHDLDRPPSNVASDSFLRGMDPGFLAAVGLSNKIVNLNNLKTDADANKYPDADDKGVTDAATRAGVRVTKDKFFLLSFTEYYMGKQTITDAGVSRSVSIGAPYEYYKRLAPAPTTGALAGRIKYLSGTARTWFARSAVPSTSSYVYDVSTTGANDNGYAFHAHGCAPACNII